MSHLFWKAGPSQMHYLKQFMLELLFVQKSASSSWLCSTALSFPQTPSFQWLLVTRWSLLPDNHYGTNNSCKWRPHRGGGCGPQSMCHRKSADLHNQQFLLTPASFFGHFSFWHVYVCKYIRRKRGQMESIRWTVVYGRELLKQKPFISFRFFFVNIILYTVEADQEWTSLDLILVCISDSQFKFFWWITDSNVC